MSHLTASYSAGDQSFWFHHSGPFARITINNASNHHWLVNLTEFSSSHPGPVSADKVIDRLRLLLPSIEMVGPSYGQHSVVCINEADIVRLRLLSIDI